MNGKLLKQAIATGLVLSLSLGAGAGAGLAKWDDGHPGKGNGKGWSQKTEKFQNRGNGKVHFKLDLDDLKLEFKDVDMEWARQHIASMVARGVFEGYEDGTFRPNNKVTRLEALVTAVRLMDLGDEAESEEAKSADLQLKDEHKIPDWARGYVAVAMENDLFLETDDKLDPYKPADRLWVATLLVKALDLEEEAREKMNTRLPFKDAGAIPAGSVGYVAAAVERGIVKGYADNTFRPHRPVTRAEIAAFLDRSSELMPEHQQGGVLKAPITDDKLILTNGTEYEVDDDAYVFYNEDRIGLDDLKAGDRVSFITYNDVIIFIKLIDKAGSDDDEAGADTYIGTLSAGASNDELRLYAGGKLAVFPIDDDADIYRGGEKVSARALKAGDEVKVRVEDGEAVRIEVTEPIEDADHLYGTVVRVDEDDGEIDIRSDGETGRYQVDDDTAIYRKDKQAGLSDLRAGDRVLVKLDDEEITYIQVTEAEDGDVVTGNFEGIISHPVDNRTLSVFVGNEWEQYKISDDAGIYRDGDRVRASSLKRGDAVEFVVEDGVVEFITVTEMAEDGNFVSGTITEVDDDDEIEIRTGEEERDYGVVEDALIFRNNEPADVDDLRVGDEVYVKAEDGELIYIQVIRAADAAFTVRGELEGIVTDASGKPERITVRHTVNGSSQASIYPVSDEVNIIGDAADLDRGQDVEVKGSRGVVTEIKIL